jgi:hypothetical protein
MLVLLSVFEGLRIFLRQRVELVQVFGSGSGFN